MEEILELKEKILNRDYSAALALVEEMEEMSRDDKIVKVKSFSKILLLHLIKQEAEKRSTRSWELSIENSLSQIADTNKRRKAGGYYLREEELAEILDEAFPLSLKMAALEAFEGTLSDEQLKSEIDPDRIKAKALGLILQYR